MKSILYNIKSKYSLQNVFGYLPYKTSLKLAKGSRYLSQCLNITLENYKKFYDIKKIIKPSYDINKYFSYLDIKHEKDNNNTYLDFYGKNDIEKILYGCLNDASFNMALSIGEKGWEYIVKNIQKIQLIISPILIQNIFNKKIKHDFFDILNTYKNNIKEISFSNFDEKNIMKFETIKEIINIIENIFTNKNIDKKNNKQNNINDDNPNIINNSEIDKYNHNVKKISFINSSILGYIDITSKFLDKIDNIISLSKIEEIMIDSMNFNEYQFTDIMKYITKKMNSLKSLKINSFGSIKSHYADLNIVCNNIFEQIEVIDLSNSFCISSLISVLNAKKRPLRELKIKIFSNKNDMNWSFLNKSINTLEVFEIETKEKKDVNYNDIIEILNKMKKLKSLKIIGGLTFQTLILFRNFENIENLNVRFDQIFSYFDCEEIEYFNYFHNLKSLTFSFEITVLYDRFDFFLPIFKLPPKIASISFNCVKGGCLMQILTSNVKNLSLLEELRINDIEFGKNDFAKLVEIFSSFKYLIKLSLNRIRFVKKKDNIYQYVPKIFENIPSIIELDISNNKYDSDILKGKLFEKIRLTLPKKLLSLKIFNDDIAISEKAFNHIIETFGLVIDLENNYPKIDKLLDFPFIFLNDDIFLDDNILLDDNSLLDNNSVLSNESINSFDYVDEYSYHSDY